MRQVAMLVFGLILIGTSCATDDAAKKGTSNTSQESWTDEDIEGLKNGCYTSFVEKNKQDYYRRAEEKGHPDAELPPGFETMMKSVCDCFVAEFIRGNRPEDYTNEYVQKEIKRIAEESRCLRDIVNMTKQMEQSKTRYESGEMSKEEYQAKKKAILEEMERKAK